MIKAAGVMGLQWLHRVLNAIWSSEEVPEKWKRGSIVPLFKKGSKKKCENYSGITLLSQGLKLMEKIIERRLRTITEIKMEGEQYGFRQK